MSCDRNSVPRWCGECWTTPTITIVQQPQPINGEVGTPHILSITAITSSGYPLHYQWCKDGLPIAGATSETYTLPDEEIDALYCCKLRDGDANEVSDSVRVEIVDISFRCRYTYADGTQLETTEMNGSGSVLTVEEASQIPESEIAGLLKIEVGPDITEIGRNVFWNSQRGSGNSVEFAHFNGDIVINDSVTIIETQAFRAWTSFNRIFIIPDGVQHIHWFAFYSFDLFNQPFIVPSSVTIIEDNAFGYWKHYDQDFTFESSTPPMLGVDVFDQWESSYPARIVTGSGADNSAWKVALTASYNGGDIESINGVLWNDIPDNFKIRMEYNDGTPAFEVPLDGSTIVTQADGDLAIGNYDVDKISKMIIGNQMNELDVLSFSGEHNILWLEFNSEVVLPNTITNIHNRTFTYWENFNNLINTNDLNVTILDGENFRNWKSFNQQFLFPSNLTTIDDAYVFSDWRSFNQQFIVPERIEYIGYSSFARWYLYNKDFIFEHTDTIPIFNDESYSIWEEWKNYYPARIVTPNSIFSNSEWKAAIGEFNYNNGDIESINGVLWNDIP